MLFLYGGKSLSCVQKIHPVQLCCFAETHTGDIIAGRLMRGQPSVRYLTHDTEGLSRSQLHMHVLQNHYVCPGFSNVESMIKALSTRSSDVKTTCNVSGPSYSYPFLSWSLLISFVWSMSCFSSLLVDSEFSSSWISSLDVWLRTCAKTTGPLSLYSFWEQAAHRDAFQKTDRMKLEGKAIKHGQ